MKTGRLAVRASILAMLFLLLAAGGAAAWEHAYGPPNSVDDGFRRVAAVNCPPYPAGYIAVGTLDATGFDPNVYVVYTDLAGGLVWGFSYDVQGLGLADQGIAIAPLPNGANGGFMILSNTRNGAWSPALTHISCSGRVLWSLVYPDAAFGYDLRGHDLIRTGNGDLAVAGSWWNGATEDAFLMRTTAAGVPLWNVAYEADGNESFNALTEAGPLSTSPTPDLVAVGRYNKIGARLQGLVARVDGSSGGIGPAPQCMAEHGDPASAEVYNSVLNLANNTFAGQYAMIGTTTGAGWGDDVWLGRGDPCNLFAQSRIGAPLAPTATIERGFDLAQPIGPVIGPAGGLLAIAGTRAPLAAGPYDATFHYVATANLLPFGANGRVFGDHGNLDDAFFSLAADPAGWPGGFVLAGRTASGLGIGDPQDLYLVHYNPPGPVQPICEKTWSPDGVALSWPQWPLAPQQQHPARYYRVDTPQFWQPDNNPTCP